jgi:hypothetical protein
VRKGKHPRLKLIELQFLEGKLFESMDDVFVLELGQGHVVDDRKQGHLATDEGDERLVGWRDQSHHLFLQPVLLKDFHLFLEHIMIVQPKQAFVGVIDAKLLETVVIKVLEPEYIQNGDFLTLKHWALRAETNLDSTEDEIEEGFIEGLAKSLLVGLGACLPIRNVSILL